ncbi:Lipase 3 [Papilio machaon]|uniref:Lipase 3 n=1 Tax=Papilio machaon TaxID=76193 RepID=A0A194QLH1_PAPMA|nr:Lipase 3 [Papilio machaon]
MLPIDITESPEEITETTKVPTETTPEMETITFTEIETESTYETETTPYTETETTDITETSPTTTMVTTPTIVSTSKRIKTAKVKTTPWSLPKPPRVKPITVIGSTTMMTFKPKLKIVTTPTNLTPSKITTTPRTIWKPKTAKTPAVLIFVSANPIIVSKQTTVKAPTKATAWIKLTRPTTVKLPKGRVFVSPNPITVKTQKTVKGQTTPIKNITPTTIKKSGVGVFVSPNPIIVTKRTTLKAVPTRTPATTLMTLPTRTTMKTPTRVVMSTTMKIPRTSTALRIPKTSTTLRIPKASTTQRLTRTTGKGPSIIVRRMSLPINKGKKIDNLSGKLLDRSIQLDLVNIHGYKAEIHTVVTPDGYLLTLHRIKPKSKFTGRNNNKTVILLHGLLGSSIDWILLGPKHSLPYKLINAGYDVWLPNVRGNAYSRAHVSKSIHSAEFWDFSWHEIGLYDLSSIIDYIREKNSVKSQIILVAHSMGATALMVLLSTSPHYNTILSFVILLAPLVFMQQAKGPLRLLSEFKSLDHNATVKILGDRSFNPVDSFMRVARKKFCKEDAILCMHPLFLLTDGGRAIKNNRHKKNILINMKTGGSVKTILHFCQLIKSGQFEMYDLGSTFNLKKYGTVSPPKYHLRDIKLPMALFNSHNDWLSTVPDILNLMSQLTNTVTHHVVQLSSTEFNHLDFVLGINAPKLVYKHVFDVLDQLF